MSRKVLASIESLDGSHCVDVFIREDATFGFEESAESPTALHAGSPWAGISPSHSRLAKRLSRRRRGASAGCRTQHPGDGETGTPSTRGCAARGRDGRHALRLVKIAHAVDWPFVAGIVASHCS